MITQRQPGAIALHASELCGGEASLLIACQQLLGEMRSDQFCGVMVLTWGKKPPASA